MFKFWKLKWEIFKVQLTYTFRDPWDLEYSGRLVDKYNRLNNELLTQQIYGKKNG